MHRPVEGEPLEGFALVQDGLSRRPTIDSDFSSVAE